MADRLLSYVLFARARRQGPSAAFRAVATTLARRIESAAPNVRCVTYEVQSVDELVDRLLATPEPLAQVHLVTSGRPSLLNLASHASSELEALAADQWLERRNADAESSLAGTIHAGDLSRLDSLVRERLIAAHDPDAQWFIWGVNAAERPARPDPTLGPVVKALTRASRESILGYIPIAQEIAMTFAVRCSAATGRTDWSRWVLDASRRSRRAAAYSTPTTNETTLLWPSRTSEWVTYDAKGHETRELFSLDGTPTPEAALWDAPPSGLWPTAAPHRPVRAAGGSESGALMSDQGGPKPSTPSNPGGTGTGANAAQPATQPSKTTLTIREQSQPWLRAFFDAEGKVQNNTGRLVLTSVASGSLPNGVRHSWSATPPGEVSFSAADKPTTTVVVRGAGLVEITCSVLPPASSKSAAVPLARASVQLSVPELFVISELPGDFDRALRRWGLFSEKQAAVDQVKSVVTAYMKGFNARFFWTKYDRRKPAVFEIDRIEFNEVHVGDVNVLPRNNSELLGYNHPQQRSKSRRRSHRGFITVYAGGHLKDTRIIPEAIYTHRVIQAFKSASRRKKSASYESIRKLLLTIFGRIVGFIIAHESFHSMLPAKAAHLDDSGHNKLIRGPVLASRTTVGIMRAPSIYAGADPLREFRYVCGIEITDPKRFPQSSSSYRDHGQAGMLQLIPENRALIEKNFPLPPKLR